MRTIKPYLMAVGVASVLAGCSNALYFYETDKIALNIEARPDASQPIQGNLGLKQRVVLVAPKKNKNDDAVSSISSFSFKSLPHNTQHRLGTVLIQTAFITGDAAAELNGLAAAAAKAIVQDGGNDAGVDLAIMRFIVDALANRHTQEADTHLSLLNALAKAVIPTKYPFPIFAITSSGAHSQTLAIDIAADTPIPAPIDMNSALDYFSDVETSAETLAMVIEHPQNYQWKNAPLTDGVIIEGLKSEYEKTKQELARLNQELAGNSVYRDARRYYIDK